MNKRNWILSLVLLLAVGLGFSACEDSLGIESNYQEKLIEKDSSNIKPPVSTKFPADSVIYAFEEIYRDPAGFDDSSAVNQEWAKKENIDYRINALLDTSETDHLLWLDIKLINRTPEFVYLPRTDRVVSFRIKVDSIVLNKDPFPGSVPEYFLDGDTYSGRWSILTIKKINQPGSLNFSELNARIYLSIKKTLDQFKVNSEDMLREYIHCDLRADLSQDGLETQKFVGTFKIFYK